MFEPPMKFEVIKTCGRARACEMTFRLRNWTAQTPMFMQVGTQGTVKGLISTQLYQSGCQVILGNTYHLTLRPGPEQIAQHGGIHKFVNWNRGILTDSGGFQMVSLLKLSEMTEEGVTFQSPHDGTKMLLTPERSIECQNLIGADIIMALDDVVCTTTEGPRVEEATHRTTRWIDRCIAAHKRPHEQSLFAIIQGGLDERLRDISLNQLIERDTPGYAIGGLSGGEEKSKFWRIVSYCAARLPANKPRYLMGVGYPLDLVVCSALGVDMFDCVYASRTARFGSALTSIGLLKLRHSEYKTDFSAIDAKCSCYCCKNYSRSYIHFLLTHNSAVGVELITLHNVTYEMYLMQQIRESIHSNTFPDFVRSFMKSYHPDGKYPDWAVEALASVDILLEN
eukprot:c4840_g1_i1.p1 GENE.c4840_g1_i1~~c4840_g1_i1.p1  ORF type:complete len:395 (+),score=163.22 c4840_g1_i1:45-1229(+)